MDIEQFNILLEETATQRDQKNKQLDWLMSHKELLLSVGGYVTTYSGVEFRNCEREDVSVIQRAVKSDDGTPWKKFYYGNTVDYTRNNGGVRIRIDGAKPPPTCKVVTEQVLVPSSFIAEHYETRTRIVCKEPTTPDASPEHSEKSDEPLTSPAPANPSADIVDAHSPTEDSSAPPSAQPTSVDQTPEISPDLSVDAGEDNRYGGNET